MGQSIMFDPGRDYVVYSILEEEAVEGIRAWAHQQGCFFYWNPQIFRHQIWVDYVLFDQFIKLYGPVVINAGAGSD